LGNGKSEEKKLSTAGVGNCQQRRLVLSLTIIDTVRHDRIRRIDSVRPGR